MQSFQGSQSNTAQRVLVHSENDVSNETWDPHMNWRNISKNNNYCDSNASESSVDVCPKIRERANLLNDIEEDFDDLAIDSQRINQEENNNEALPELKELNINSEFARNSKLELAGKLESIVGSLGIVLVKPTVVNKLLGINTPLFVCVSDSRSESFTNFTLLGHIDDILGSVGNPVYCVPLEPNIENCLREEENIYYAESHPGTSSICVKEETDRTFRLIHQRGASYSTKNKMDMSKNRKRGQVNKNYWRYFSHK